MKRKFKAVVSAMALCVALAVTACSSEEVSGSRKKPLKCEDGTCETEKAAETVKSDTEEVTECDTEKKETETIKEQEANNGTEAETAKAQEKDKGKEAETAKAQKDDNSRETETAKELEKENGTETQKPEKAASQKEKVKETEKVSEETTEKEKENLLEELPGKGHIVGIDPGHQGSWVDMSDPEPNAPGSSEYKAKCTAGTTGRFTGVAEYELTLEISLALREELEARGYQVILTREDHDTAISNAERAQKVAEEGGEIYVRIHANGSDDSSVEGALGMCQSPQNPYVGELYEESYCLSDEILTSYCEATGFENLGVQYYDNMTGINWSTVPVTILEMGFMTNEGDDTAMQDPQMQEKMVQGIADGIDAYFETAEEDAAVDSDTEKEEDNDSLNEEREQAIGKIAEQYAAPRELNGEKWSISVQDLKTDQKMEYNSQARLQSASVIKVFIMGTVYDRICYPSSSERAIDSQETYAGELRSLLEQMITVSDNEAANQLVIKLGQGDFQKGAEAVNQFCKENGYTSTSLGRRFLESNPTGENYTSAADCTKILADIYHGTCVNEEASGKMLDILKQQQVKTKISLGVPNEIRTANKTGEMPEGYGLGCIENDMAIVFGENGDYVITVLSNDLDGRNEEAVQVIRQISAEVYALF